MFTSNQESLAFETEELFAHSATASAPALSNESIAAGLDEIARLLPYDVRNQGRRRMLNASAGLIRACHQPVRQLIGDDVVVGLRERGIQSKPFTEHTKARGFPPPDLSRTPSGPATHGRLPDNFIVTLPKVTIPEQLRALVTFLELLETALGLETGALKMEMMVETTQAIMDDSGRNPLMRFIRAGQGRLIATHFGTYDYTASCGITAKYQEMNHPVCDFAHHVTKVALAHTGIWLSDGATNTMPIGPHRGEHLSLSQLEENRETVHRAWKKGYDHIRHSLWNGYYQGWDLNPAQLPMRYAAVYAFFLESYEDAVERLKTFVEKAARATLIGDVFDDAATGQGLLNYFLRALNSGAITATEVLKTGLTLDEIRSRSFKKILENRASR